MRLEDVIMIVCDVCITAWCRILCMTGCCNCCRPCNQHEFQDWFACQNFGRIYLQFKRVGQQWTQTLTTTCFGCWLALFLLVVLSVASLLVIITGFLSPLFPLPRFPVLSQSLLTLPLSSLLLLLHLVHLLVLIFNLVYILTLRPSCQFRGN